MTLLDMIRSANQPGPPENSVRLRFATTSAVLVGVAACAAQRELAPWTALLATIFIAAGMIFSYRTRHRPPGYVKVAAALAALSLLVWFVAALSGGPITDITTVEDPLTVLFVGIQAVHSFHVPARRDLIFTLAGGAALMALAGAQSIELGFLYYALPWLNLTLWALVELWRSVSGGGSVSIRTTAHAVVAVLTATFAVFLLLPAPNIAVRIGFVTRPGSAGPIKTPGALAGDSGGPSQLSKSGSPAGRSRIGGYLGFANRLDTALRGGLGRTLVMRVRAQIPSYWIGETYDRWDGQNWISTITAKETLRGGSPFYFGLPFGDVPGGQADLQTFFVAQSTPNLVFHADAARQVWFPASSLDYAPDGTIVSPIGLGKGAVYTVESYVNDVIPSRLRSSDGYSTGLGIATRAYTQLPNPYTQVSALARSVTAGATNTYDKVQSLIAWIDANTRYSTQIPPLPAGHDTVDEFLFGTRIGFCEQISTSLAVMLRTLGIPAREVVGYIPGSYNPVTDLYEVRAEDAHAWVQVWFPGFGWQSFDPTASVPSANPSPGTTALRSIGHALSRIPPAPAALAIGGIAALLGAARWLLSRSRTWTDAIVKEMARAGKRHKRNRCSSETLLEYAAALDFASSGRSTEPGWLALASAVTAGYYGPEDLLLAGERALVEEARRIRRANNPRAFRDRRC